MFSSNLIELLLVAIVIYIYIRGKKLEKILVVCSIVISIVNSFALEFISGYLGSIVDSITITIIFINTIKRKHYVWCIVAFLLLLYYYINLIAVLFVLFRGIGESG